MSKSVRPEATVLPDLASERMNVACVNSCDVKDARVSGDGAEPLRPRGECSPGDPRVS